VRAEVGNHEAVSLAHGENLDARIQDAYPNPMANEDAGQGALSRAWAKDCVGARGRINMFVSRTGVRRRIES
jgi:hypothetical protein